MEAAEECPRLMSRFIALILFLALSCQAGAAPTSAEIVRESIPISYADLNQTCSLLRTLVPDVRYTPDPHHHNTLNLEGPQAAIDQAKELLEQIDRPKDFIMIDVKLVELSETGLRARHDSPTKLTGTTATSFLDETVEEDEVAGLNFFYIPAPCFGSASANLQYLINQNAAHVLATPRFGTFAGKPVHAGFGDNLCIPAFDPQTGKFHNQYLRLGADLDLTINLHDSNTIECDTDLQISTITDLIDAQHPRKVLRRTTPRLTLKDGDTLVIADLFRDVDIQAIRQIPILSELPHFGVAFQHAHGTLALMITPHIMR
jgi:type II secretory pathway component GspD/PulD (secretin)